MNRIKAILLAGCIFSFTFSYAQTKNGTTLPNERNNVTKGYYSIHRNHEKLNQATSIHGSTKSVTADVTSDVFPKKGFYGIGKNRRRTSGVSLNQDPSQGGVRSLPQVVTKGYYSIGDNSRKLHK
jgi:hypothetical protein